MDKKNLIIFLVTFGLLGALITYIVYFDNPDGTKKEPKVLINETLNKVTGAKKDEDLASKSFFQDKDVINILLIGKDIGKERRAKGQTGYNTDILILLSINPKKNKALLTSFPRDIWQNGGRINSIMVNQGTDSILDAISTISGQKVDKYISIDFDGIRWLVNQFNGVPVEVETSFTDNSFPDINDTRTTTVSFTKGTEIMTGDRALTFARSRKGNNGEGSDLMRAKRQHLILKGMDNSVEKEDSKFFPFKIDEFYNEVIKNTQTNVTLEDAYYIFSFYKNIKSYQIQSLVLDERYIYHPEDASPYGGAWVFVAKDSGYGKLHKDINDYLFTDVNPLSTQ